MCFYMRQAGDCNTTEKVVMLKVPAASPVGIPGPFQRLEGESSSMTGMCFYEPFNDKYVRSV